MLLRFGIDYQTWLTKMVHSLVDFLPVEAERSVGVRDAGIWRPEELV